VQGGAHQHGCVGLLVRVRPGDEVQPLSCALSLLRGDVGRGRRGLRRAWPPGAARPATQANVVLAFTALVPHLQQLLGLLTEPVRSPQVQGAEVGEERLVELRGRSGMSAAFLWPKFALPLRNGPLRHRPTAHQLVIDAVDEVLGRELRVPGGIGAPEGNKVIEARNDLGSLRSMVQQGGERALGNGSGGACRE
jgi:hypothetical protein